MGNQLTFASRAWNGKAESPGASGSLAEVDAVIPWARLLALVAPR